MSLPKRDITKSELLRIMSLHSTTEIDYTIDPDEPYFEAWYSIDTEDPKQLNVSSYSSHEDLDDALVKTADLEHLVNYAWLGTFTDDSAATVASSEPEDVVNQAQRAETVSAVTPSVVLDESALPSVRTIASVTDTEIQTRLAALQIASQYSDAGDIIHEAENLFRYVVTGKVSPAPVPAKKAWVLLPGKQVRYTGPDGELTPGFWYTVGDVYSALNTVSLLDDDGDLVNVSMEYISSE